MHLLERISTGVMHVRRLVSSFVLWACCMDTLVSSSLIQRLREKQSNDENKSRGLDLTTDAWIHVPQVLQDVLASIDDRLRGLDTFGYTLKLARLDFSLEQLVRRLENIETKLGRLETKFDLRMEKVEEVVIGKDIKEEFSNEHLSRRMEHLNDKLNNKAAFLDAKIDIKMERITNKLELLERDLHNSVDDILEKLVKSDDRHLQFESTVLSKFLKVDDVVNSVSDLRIFLKEELVNLFEKRMDKLDTNTVTILGNVDKILIDEEAKSKNNLNHLGDKMDRFHKELTVAVNNISFNCNGEGQSRSLATRCETSARIQTQFQQQMESLTSLVEKSVKMEEVRFKELDTDIEVSTKKLMNSIQESKRNSDEQKSLLIKVLENGNRSQSLLRQEQRDRIEQSSKYHATLADVSGNLDKKVTELRSTVDTSFATLLVAQNTFISTCKRIQEEETQIYDILQQMVLEMRNRSVSDVYKIGAEVQQNGIKLAATLEKILAAASSCKNETIREIRKHVSKCSLGHKNWKQLSEMAMQNGTRFEDANDFQEFTNDSDQLGRMMDVNGTTSDYDADYPVTETDYDGS
ncbi:golgin subfamily A member 4-like [Centruroides sculpturatus]|uniref:golgin subfamily A member 4-like n=1 Tax=Centruroides sculpturatus TaxID=218467 RepID=UPI000C6C983F|nr:golgin subfamily A member 4-like [Centruroides sculpturatus]